MKRRPLATLAFAVTALLSFATLALTPACAIGPASPKYDGANIVLISIDTLRADRLGVYGYARAETPRIDRLAREGIRFEQVISPMPLTLPAHTSLMTALPTPAHGVQDNGAFEIALGATTLAEQLQEAGYENGAFIGAFVLHSRWGLNRGFAEYNDNFEYAQPGGMPGQVERRAEAVIDAALEWLRQPREGPWFAWVHLYDPHSPYSAPEPYLSRYADRPYDAEIAYADAQIGRLLDELDSDGELDNTVVVLTADHGEGLGEHDEPGHGMFLYDTTILVPLVIRLPDRLGEGREVGEQVQLIDVAPTILELVGVAIPESFSGLSLTPFFQGEGGSSRVAYSETYYPRWHFGWQELHALRKDGFKYILAPNEELYDLRSDPTEINNLVAQEPARVAALREEVERIRGGGVLTAPGRLSGEATERLRALGYIGSAPTDLGDGLLPDPKNKIHLFTRTTDAQGKLVTGDYAEAIRILREVIDEDPRIVSAHLTLGNALFRQGRFPEAAEAFEASLALRPDEDIALSNLGLAHRRLGDVETARSDFEALLALDPMSTTAYFNLGEMALEADDPRTAERHFENAIEINDQQPGPHFGLGVAAYQQGFIDRAIAQFDRVESLASLYLELRYYRALIYERRGDLGTAKELYQAEVDLNPQHHRSWLNLSQIYVQQGDHQAAVEALRRGVDADPQRAPAHILLARSLLALEDPSTYSDAEAAARRGITLGTPPELLPLAHYVLADIYNRLGRPEDVERELSLARQAEKAIGR